MPKRDQCRAKVASATGGTFRCRYAAKAGGYCGVHRSIAETGRPGAPPVNFKQPSAYRAMPSVTDAHTGSRPMPSDDLDAIVRGIAAERDDLARTHTQKMSEYLVKVGELRAERDAARAECLSLQATIRKLTAPIEADEYPMPARNDPSFAAKRLAFAREANERVWDALQVEGHPCASDLWSKEGKAAKAAGLYAPSTYYADAGSGLKGKLRNAGIPVAGDWNAKRPAALAPSGGDVKAMREGME